MDILKVTLIDIEEKLIIIASSEVDRPVSVLRKITVK